MYSRGIKLLALPMALASIVIVACTASGTLHTSTNIAGVRMQNTTRFSTDGSTSVTNDTGKCFEVKWYGSSGQEVGSTMLVPGANHGAIPAGATTWTAVEKPCPPTAGGGGGMQTDSSEPPDRALTGNIQGGVARLSALSEFLVIGAPILFDDASPVGNAMYEFRIRASGADEAIGLARQAVTSPLGSAIDPRITIVHWLRTRVAEHDGRSISLARSPFASFEVEWNDDPAFADLSTANNAVPCSIGSGLWAVTSSVNASDVNGDGEWNRVVVRQAHGDSAGVGVLEFAMRHDP